MVSVESVNTDKIKPGIHVMHSCGDMAGGIANGHSSTLSRANVASSFVSKGNCTSVVMYTV